MSAYVGRLFTTLSSAFTDFNTATLSGAIDILVIEDDHGRRQSTPFHVRFGKLQLLKARGIPVNIELNGTKTNLRMFLGAAGEAYFFNPDAAVSTATSLDFDVDTPQHVPLKDANHLQPPFDLPTKAATQQLPPTSLLFPSSSANQPSVPSHSVPSDFDPCCSTVAIVPSQVAASDLVPSDRRFEYCSDSDVELTRAERDGTAQVAQTTHSPPMSLSDRSDRKWSTAVTVSFAQFHLQRSLPTAVADDPSPPSGESQPADEFSEALFDLPATPPPKRSSSRRSTASHDSHHKEDVLPDHSTSAGALSFDVHSPPSTPVRELRDADSSPSVLSTRQSSVTNGSLLNVAHVTDELSTSDSPDLPADGASSTASPQTQTASVTERDVRTTPTSTNDGTQDEPSVSLLSSHGQTYSSLESPSDAEHECRISKLTSGSHHAQNGERTPSNHAAQQSIRSEENLPASADVVSATTFLSDKQQRETLPTESNAVGEVFVVNTATQTSSQSNSSDQFVHSSCDGNSDRGKDDRKLNGKITASKDQNHSVADRDEGSNQTKLSVQTNMEMVSTELAAAVPADKKSDMRLESDVQESTEEPHSIPPLSDGEGRNEDTDGWISMSLCGNLITEDTTSDKSLHLFDEHRIPYEEFVKNPEILYDPSLMFRIEGRLVDFKIAAPYVFSAACFRRNPDLDTLRRSRRSEGDSMNEPPKPPASIPARRFRWFYWSNETGESSPEDSKEGEGNEEAGSEEREGEGAECDLHDAPTAPDDEVQVEPVLQAAEAIENPTMKEKSTKVEPPDEEKESSGDTIESNGTPLQPPNASVPGMVSFSDIDPKALSLIPTAEQLMQLELKPGPNTIRFIVESSSVELNCRIFLWSCHTKIVISDVDGTITRSDVLGHLLPAVGRDWSQVGVAGLYSQIEKNGYKILYLTARPIGQASQTRAFLHSVTQGSAKLPNGPVLMSPNRLVESFAREVIRRRPHEFKIAALRQVLSLFSPDYNPFHAGFGNRETDVISYRAVGLIPQRIFVVNTRGELAVMKARYESTASYSSLQDLVENVFPDISGQTGFEMIRAITDTAPFNDWKWWKGSLPEVDFDALLGE